MPPLLFAAPPAAKSFSSSYGVPVCDYIIAPRGGAVNTFFKFFSGIFQKTAASVGISTKKI